MPRRPRSSPTKRPDSCRLRPITGVAGLASCEAFISYATTEILAPRHHNTLAPRHLLDVCAGRPQPPTPPGPVRQAQACNGSSRFQAFVPAFKS
jgi:hypothetical protein